MFKILAPLIVLVISATSCTSLNSVQKRDLQDWRAKNLEVKEKDQTTAAVLNILPGFGDFYNGNVGYGIGNLLLWPLSVLWAPIGGVSGADEVNYYASKAYVEELENKKKQLKNAVEVAFIGNEITKQEFLIAHKKIDAMSLTEFQKPIGVRDILPRTMENLEQERIPTSVKK